MNEGRKIILGAAKGKEVIVSKADLIKQNGAIFIDPEKEIGSCDDYLRPDELLFLKSNGVKTCEEAKAFLSFLLSEDQDRASYMSDAAKVILAKLERCGGEKLKKS